MNRLSANIAFFQKLYNVKQDELVAAVGCDRKTFKRRRDLDTFTVRDLIIIARELHTSVEKLCEGVK